MPKMISLPFKREMADLIDQDKKLCTTRPYPAGHTGDTFMLRGQLYRLEKVTPMQLRLIANGWWKAEGFTSSLEFIKYWNMLHPYKKFQPEQTGYLHIFSKVQNEK